MPPPPPQTGPSDIDLDAVVIGGGIAGLWLLNLLTGRGYSAVLLEADRLGGCQTLASQGMIHGGIKYALSGRLTGASEAIADMPARWRRCLSGNGELDLSGLTPLSERYYLFADDGTLGRLTTFFASRSIRGRVRRLQRNNYPPALAVPGFGGVVYELDDFVLDTGELLEALRQPVADRAYQRRVEPDDLVPTDDACVVDCGSVRLRARRIIVTAGAGAESLLDRLGAGAPQMQRRPLHQVLVRHDYPDPLYAHCLTGIRRAEPRLTITSHRPGDPGSGDHNTWLWYLGGQIAGDGVALTEQALITHARRELASCVPWIRWQDAEFSTLRINRAEPALGNRRRPDQAFAAAAGSAVVAWPTKLSLVPDLGDRVLGLLPPPGAPDPPHLDLPVATVGRAPWIR